MNIIKFNDVILSAETDPQLTQEQIDIFNDNFRGRYVYNVNMTDAVALEQMSTEQYREASKSKYIEKKIIEYKKINQYEELLDGEGNIDSSKQYYWGIINPFNDGNSYIVDNYNSGYYVNNIGNIYNSDGSIDEETDERIINECIPFRVVPSSYCVYEAKCGEVNFENRFDPYKYYFDVRLSKDNRDPNIYYICIYAITGDEEEWGSSLFIFDREIKSEEFPYDLCAESSELRDFIENNENVKFLLEVEDYATGQTSTVLYDIHDSNAKVKPFCLEDLTKPYYENYDCVAYNKPSNSNVRTSRTVYNHEHNDGCWKPAFYLGNNGGEKGYPYSNSFGLVSYIDYWKWHNGRSYTGDNNRFLVLEYVRQEFSEIKNLQCPDAGNKHIVSLICRIEKTIYVENPDYLADFDSIPLELLNTRRYINFDTTENVNSVTRFIESNKFHPDEDITVGELQNFRWWLAHELLELNAETEKRYDVLEMLRYYEQNMYDDTIRHLTTFTPKAEVDILTAANRSTCGCQGVTGINILSAGLTTCDPIYLYRKAVYEKMVDTFSDVSFWTNQTIEFLEEFKRYIDGIIKMNFPLYTVDYISDLYDCGCLSDANASQERLMSYLKNLSKSLGYIIDEDMSSHKNFIGDSFNKWAAYLYEKMSWV